jgi:hypothetical protein
MPGQPEPAGPPAVETASAGKDREEEPAPPATKMPTQLPPPQASPPSAPTASAPTASAPTAGAPTAPPEPGKSGAPLVRLVNTKRITLNFQVQNVGLSGLSCVELWYTQDCKEWKKYDAPMQAQAYVVEVDEEGMYGFTLRAKSGLGLGKEPPQAGDQPQVWVIVDLSKPEVQLQDVAVSVTGKVQQVAIKWKATDKNLARQPVALSYAEKADGPWTVIAANVENNGQYLWHVPADAPAKFLVRVEAIDLAGNLGRAQTKDHVLLDMMKPEVLITNIEANPGK